jgi:hypothetical protein
MHAGHDRLVHQFRFNGTLEKLANILQLHIKCLIIRSANLLVQHPLQPRAVLQEVSRLLRSFKLWLVVCAADCLSTGDMAVVTDRVEH